MVKRVIGMPGDIVSVRDKIIYINGKEFTRGYECYDIADPSPPQAPRQVIKHRFPPNYIDYVAQNRWYEPYIVYDPADSLKLVNYNRDWFGPIRVPEGKYFVLGDNRDVSEDSRYWGFLDRGDITGTPWLIFFSKGIEYNKIGDVPHTRWDRAFRWAK